MFQVLIETDGVGMMPHQGISDLYAIRAKTSENTGYYVDTILEKFCIPAINRTHISGSVQKRCMVEDGSTCVFMR